VPDARLHVMALATGVWQQPLTNWNGLT
jgi:hypothetical protein